MASGGIVSGHLVHHYLLGVLTAIATDLAGVDLFPAADLSSGLRDLPRAAAGNTCNYPGRESTWRVDVANPEKYLAATGPCFLER